MKRCENGVMVDMTPEEVASRQAEADQSIEPAVQTPEERIAELEAVVADLMTAMEALV